MVTRTNTRRSKVGEQRRLWRYTDRFLRDGVEGKNEEQERKVRRVLMPKIGVNSEDVDSLNPYLESHLNKNYSLYFSIFQHLISVSCAYLASKK